jgi:hypothetical protein
MIFISSSARPRFGRRTFLSERRSAECTCAHFNGDIRPKLPASLSSMTPEEDLEYLVNGKSTPGVKMTYDQMEAVFAPLLKIRLRPASFPPRSKHLTTGCRKNFRRCAYGPRGDSRRERTCRTAESWRQEFFALRKLHLEKLHALDDLPLVVLARGKKTTDLLRKREAELVGLRARANR